MQTSAEDAFLQAAHKKDVEAVRRYLLTGAYADCINIDGNSALHLAVSPRDNAADSEDEQTIADIIDVLILSGIGLDIENKNGYTALVLAAVTEQYNVVKQLAEAGACVDLLNMELVVSVTPTIADLLFQWGAIFHIDMKQRLQMTSADINEFTDVNARLNKADVEMGTTVLHYATMTCNHALLKRLIYLGANPNTRNKSGGAPVLNALCSCGWNRSTFETLLAGGLNVNAVIDSNFSRPLHRVVRNNDLDAAKLLVEAGANVNARDKRRRTPVFSAIDTSNMEMLQFLMRAGINLNLEDMYNMTALDYALTRDDDDIIKVLIKSGARPCKDTVPRRLLVAATLADESLLEYLVSLHVDLNSKDKNGRSPLHKAVLRQSPESVAILIEGGADVDTRDRWGMAPLNDAERNSNRLILTMLKEQSV